MGLRVVNRGRFFGAIGVVAALVVAVVAVIVHAGGGGNTHLTTSTTVRRTTTTSSSTTTTTIPPTTTTASRRTTTTARRVASGTTTTAGPTRTTLPPLRCTWSETTSSAHDSVTFRVTSPDVAPNSHVHYYFTYAAPAHGGPTYWFGNADAQGGTTMAPVPIDPSMEGGKITATYNTLPDGGQPQSCTSPTYTVHYAN